VSVVVSDTSPLHHFILCSVDAVLPRLFQRVIIPPTVFLELQHPNTPTLVQEWMRSLPAWIAVQKPTSLDPTLNVDAAELEAICLAREIHAAAILLDDRAGRGAAVQHGLPVIGTMGLLESAAVRGWIDLPQVLERLQQTNTRLDPKLIAAALERHRSPWLICCNPNIYDILSLSG
jgi:predicted nucleic acid-binding protein